MVLWLADSQRSPSTLLDSKTVVTVKGYFAPIPFTNVRKEITKPCLIPVGIKVLKWHKTSSLCCMWIMHIWNIPAQIPLCRPQSDIPVDSTAATSEAPKKCKKRMLPRQNIGFHFKKSKNLYDGRGRCLSLFNCNLLEHWKLLCVSWPEKFVK